MIDTLINGLIGFGAIAVLYMVPSIIAYNRNHNERNAIIVLNIFAGWTVVGWIIAIVWAVTSDIKKKRR